jgi:hypothetical protein
MLTICTIKSAVIERRKAKPLDVEDRQTTVVWRKFASPNGGQVLGTPRRASAAGAQRDQIVCFASVAANCLMHNPFTVGACVEVGQVPDTFELVFDADGVHRPYHVLWRKNKNWSGVITAIPPYGRRRGR